MWSKKSWNGSSGPFPLSSLAFLGLGREWTLPRPGPNLWEAHSPVNAFTHRCTYKYTQIGKEGRGVKILKMVLKNIQFPKSLRKPIVYEEMLIMLIQPWRGQYHNIAPHPSFCPIMGGEAESCIVTKMHKNAQKCKYRFHLHFDVCNRAAL